MSHVAQGANLVDMTTFELRDHLLTLRAECAAAALEGIDSNDLYVEELRGEIEATRHALIGAAVTDIASLRAQLSGPLAG
jgi:hypothetical protein